MRLALGLAAASACLALAAGTAIAVAHAAAPAAALADPARPETDRARDADRKSAEVLAFSQVKAGDKVADIFPGGGYYTRIFAAAVGPKGQVYMTLPSEVLVAEARFKPEDTAKAVAAAYKNVQVITPPIMALKAPEPLDVVFNSQFYHDEHNPAFGGPDIARINKAVFDALKPGGLYIVIDHSAPAGTALRDIATTHRIDEAAAKAELIAAGFKLEAESQVLRNPADDRSLNVFAPPVRGKTDQFMLRLRKPK